MKLNFTIAILLIGSIINFSYGQDVKQGNYTFNRAPLVQTANVQLPLGSIKAKGWLLEQLKLQKDGFTGHAEELYPGKDDLGLDADWLGGDGRSWEKAPYYLKGLVALAYTLNDADLKLKAQKWIDYTLDHQQENGLFGPPNMKDWWPRMPFMYALQSYYEATNDKRVIPFLSKYFKYELAHLDADPLKDWAKSRAGDNIEIALWVYNKTGEKHLLDLANKLKEQAYPWADIFNKNEFDYFGRDYQPKHMVNVAQALKFPAIYWQLDQSAYYKNALENGVQTLKNSSGQPTGMASGTERLSGKSSVQGVETCTVVEWMQSLETAARLLQDPKIGDQLEKIAFNALPAQFNEDLMQHTYYTLPNQVTSVIGGHGFNQDYHNGIVPGPYSGFPCCRYNMHMGWPYFVKNSWSATPNGGLAVTAYAPMDVNAKVGSNVPIKFSVITNYPFEEQIKLKITTAKEVNFPLVLRIPGWCKNPTIAINGKLLNGVKTGEFYTIDRKWADNEEVVLNFPMHVNLTQQVNNGVSVERGPIVYALKIAQDKENLKTFPIAGFAETQVMPASDWNYGLILNAAQGNGSFYVIKSKMPINPFVQGETPITITANAKTIPGWTLDYNKTAAFDVPVSPVASTEKIEKITLVPYGSETIRLSIFPTIGTPKPTSKNYSEDFNNNQSNGLVTYGGAWFYKDNAIHAAPNEDGKTGNGTKIIATKTNFSNFIFKADISVNTAGNAGLLFRVTNPAIGADAYKGYYLGFNAETGTVELGKADGAKWLVIASAKYPLKLKENNKVEVKATGDKFAVYLNGAKTPILNARDSEYTQGSIGLRSYNAVTVIDNIDVVNL